MTSRAIDPRLLAGIVLTAAITACGGGSGGGPSAPQATAPPPIVVTHTYPPNVAAPSGGGTAWDITQVTTTLTDLNPGVTGQLYDTLQIDMTFQQNIRGALPAPGQRASLASQLAVATMFDPDGNAGGNLQGCSPVGTTPFSYFTDSGASLGRLMDGNYAIYINGGPAYTTGNAGGFPGLEAVTTISGSILTQTYRLSALGVVTPSVPKLKVQFLVYNGLRGHVTECVPLDGSEISTTGP